MFSSKQSWRSHRGQWSERGVLLEGVSGASAMVGRFDLSLWVGRVELVSVVFVAGLMGRWARFSRLREHVTLKVKTRGQSTPWQASQRNPEKCSCPLPLENKTLSACHALRSARIAPRPRPKCPDGLPVSMSLAFCLKVLVLRDTFENRRKHDKP